MTVYRAPVADTMFVLRDVLKIGELDRLPGFGPDALGLAEDVLAQVGEFAEHVLHPLNAVADRHGCVRHDDGSVSAPPGFREAYAKFVAGGWPGMAGPEEHGGGGLPLVVTLACHEYLWSANPAFTMTATSLGHARILLAHADERLRATYAGKLVSGEWTGTMGLTEPQAGSDLSLVRTRAVAREDGTYGVTGTKVFTSGGGHDLTPNIVHLVLARLPGAPAGTAGLSLFLVPQRLPGEDGEPGRPNRVTVVRVEDKMGLHGSATCQMAYDDATGHLVGEPNRGLAAMFLLMNDLRLMTAALGVGVSEVAYQNAAAYAKERLQGRAPRRTEPAGAADPIIEQPDVRRRLLTVRAFNEAARALLLWTALQSDIAGRSPDSGERAAAGQRLRLLTPVLKGMFTEVAFDNAVEAQQVFGGYGYVTETGVDQFIRDVRMAAYGEGVTPIQAMDLVHRKLGLADGWVVRDLFATIERDVAASSLPAARFLPEALAHLRDATDWITAAGAEAVAAGCVSYLHLFGRVCLGWMWVRIASADPSSATKATLARFFLARLPATTAHRLDEVRAETETVLALPADAF